MPAPKTLLLIPLGLCTCLAAQDSVAPEPAPWRATKTSLYLAFTSARQHLPAASAALELARQASATSLEGRPAEAEVMAERSFAILKEATPANPLLLDPLQTLASAQLDQRKIGSARETVRRMREIPAPRPEDKARVEGTVGALRQIEGHPAEAETHYRNAWAAWQQAGKANSAEASTALTCLGTLYTNAGRYAEAEQMLDRALAVLNASRNATRLDRIKLWNNRAVLYGRQAKWRPAETEMRNAVTAAQTGPPLDPVYVTTLLANFAQILRASGHTAEARAIETRAAAVRQRLPQSTVVDVTELPVRVQKYF
ncbi:MAG: tetratricopeptide repeat protein [Candidatus Solibacter sp.]